MFVFIISWSGQHENAKLIAKEVLKITNELAIVYSDSDPGFIFDAPCKLIRRPNELFWEDKFKACLDNTGNDGMLVIHADCSCEDWAFLVRRCCEVNQGGDDIGVWAPKIDAPYWNLAASGIFKMENSALVVSAIIDAIVFYLSPQIISRMRRITFGNNKYGWGIGGLFCAASYVYKKLVVIDTAVEVVHPQGRRGYDEGEAKIQMREFFNQFSLMERLEHHLLVTHVNFNHLKLRHKQRSSVADV